MEENFEAHLVEFEVLIPTIHIYDMVRVIDAKPAIQTKYIRYN